MAYAIWRSFLMIRYAIWPARRTVVSRNPLYILASWAYALAAGDVTGDGRDDLVFTVPDSLGYGAVGVIPQGNDGQPASAQFYPAYAYAQALALADLNERWQKRRGCGAFRL